MPKIATSDIYRHVNPNSVSFSGHACAVAAIEVLKRAGLPSQHAGEHFFCGNHRWAAGKQAIYKNVFRIGFGQE
jgi:hypothetical protein